MGRRSWIHFIGSKEKGHDLIDFVKIKDEIFIVGSAIIKGQILSYDGRIFGKKRQESLVLLTQSDGSFVIEEMMRSKLTDQFHTVLLDDLLEEEVESSKKGVIIKKAEYLDLENFKKRIENLPDFSLGDSGLSIEVLKKLMTRFEDEKSVGVFLDLYDDEYPEKKFGIEYNIEKYVNDNGHLFLWISDSLDRLFKSLDKINKMHQENQ